MRLGFILILFTIAPVAVASDYAAQVVEYVEGSGVPDDFISFDSYNDPNTALGRPTIDTTGDNNFTSGTGSAANPVPVVPVYQPFRFFEIVSIGQGGHLTLKFDHPVTDNPLNPCGTDFVVFGNANQLINGSSYWRNGNPNLMTVRGGMSREPARVSVSQDGVNWYIYTSGPFADDFAPTLGRIYDPANYEPSLPNNMWWGAPTDPTYPLDPWLTAASFTGWSVAQIAIKYGCSAGGTGFDLAISGLPWIQYVRIDNPVGSGVVPEVDAIADVAARVLPDYDCDSDVDDDDLEFFENCATGPSLGPPLFGCERADLDQDDDVDQVDFAILQRCRTGPGRLLDLECVNN